MATLPQKSRIYILLKCLENIYQDGSCVIKQISASLKELIFEVIHGAFSNHNGINLVSNKKEYRKTSKRLKTKQSTSKYWVKDEAQRKYFIKYIELSENKTTAYQNLWSTVKSILRGNFITLNTYIRKEKKFQINH